MEQAAFTLKLTEVGEVVLIMEDVRIVLGQRDIACEELCRFLQEIDFGDCGRE